MARKRKAGDGTVRQRKDGRWEGRIVIGYDDNGYPKTKNVLAKTKKECVEKLQKLKEECGGLKPEKVRTEMPFGDWLAYWYENHSKPKIRPTTQETYESRIRLHIIPDGQPPSKPFAKYLWSGYNYRRRIQIVGFVFLPVVLRFVGHFLHIRLGYVSFLVLPRR